MKYHVLLMAFLLPFSNGMSTAYEQIALDAAPATHSSHSGVSSLIQCALACSGLSDSPCTGFQLTSSRCVLYTGTILVKARDGLVTNEEIAYKKKIPKCEDYDGFSTLSTDVDQVLFCLYVSPTVKPYDPAKEDCLSRRSRLLFPDDKLKLETVTDYVQSKKGTTNFWMGARWDESTNKFKGELPGKALDTTDSMWYFRKPEFLERDHCLLGIRGQLSNTQCRSDYNYVCEILEFSENPNIP